MHIISAVDSCGSFSFRIPMEHHAHTTLETTGPEDHPHLWKSVTKLNHVCYARERSLVASDPQNL
jgi:hypothetical protein